jgi:hypothetical protein
MKKGVTRPQDETFLPAAEDQPSQEAITRKAPAASSPGGRGLGEVSGSVR